MAVLLELAPGDTLVVGGSTRIRMVQKSGQRARLAIDSHEDVERIKAGDPVPPISAAAPVKAAPTQTPAQAPVVPFLQRHAPTS